MVILQASVWRYVVKAGKQPEFEELYGPGGLWAALFHESKAYHGTVLLRSHARDREYTTIDFWDRNDEYEAFKAKFASPFAALDREGDQLTEREEHLGWFEDLPT